MEPATIENNIYECEKKKEVENTIVKKPNPLFQFMGIGSLIYAFFYTFCLYKNNSGITYPFFVGGTCLFFFFYLKKSGITAKKFSGFIVVSLMLLGISTCTTDSWVLIFFNKLGFFCLFFYLALHNVYEDKSWDLSKYIGAVINVVCTSFAFIFTPFSDFSIYLKSRNKEQNKSEGKGKYVLLGILAAIPLLIVVLMLLGSADAVFGDILTRIFAFDINDNFWGIIFSLLFAFFAAYSIMYRLSKHNLTENIPDKKILEPVIGITLTGILSAVYFVFCMIQIIYLFGGWGTLPNNYTYSSYAREGFFQLVFVCLINLSLVITCMKHFRENGILKGVLTFISICTYIMIASSAYRMILYIQVYFLTFLRLFVLWALLVIFLLMTGALLMIYRRNFPLMKYCIITVTSFYLAFSFAHPDFWIACYNLDHSVSSTEAAFNDFNYLRYILSYDAAPAILEKAEEYGYENSEWFERYLYDIEKNIPQKISARKWNLSRWMAVRSARGFLHFT